MSYMLSKYFSYDDHNSLVVIFLHPGQQKGKAVIRGKCSS